MQFIETDLPDVLLIQSKVYSDERGFFAEVFKASEFAQVNLPTYFSQENYSFSVKHTLRGLHYQIRRAQGKLIQVMQGEIFDVAVDLRQSSSTFGAWTGQRLSDKEIQWLWIPPGFAHGFYVVSDHAGVFYKTTDRYAPTWERTLRWNDPALGIEWPIPKGIQPLISAKDSNGLLLTETEKFA
jgi:dTDP-4-dehydrorhamnose 3,5-epimerase